MCSISLRFFPIRLSRRFPASDCVHIPLLSQPIPVFEQVACPKWITSRILPQPCSKCRMENASTTIDGNHQRSREFHQSRPEIRCPQKCTIETSHPDRDFDAHKTNSRLQHRLQHQKRFQLSFSKFLQSLFGLGPRRNRHASLFDLLLTLF